MKVLLVFSVLGLFLRETLSYKVMPAPPLTTRPQWLKVCRRNDPEVEHCLNDLFTALFPYLATGIPEIKVEQFEPLHLDRVSISKGVGAITLAGSLYDLHIKGSSNATPSNTKFSTEKKYWNFNLDLPFLDIKSNYNLKGNILVLPLVGHGGCDLKLGKVLTKVNTNLSLPKIEGRERIQIENMQVRFNVGQMRIKLSNLFNGNKILGNTVNAFLNQNGLEIVSELEDSIASSLASIFKVLMNNIFSKIPTDLWLLDDQQYEAYLKEEASKPKVSST